MAHTLPPLPYKPDALEPHIDTQTMQIHHGKHHQGYVNNLNAAIEKAPELAKWSLDQLCRDLAKVPEGVRGAVRNNGGGHWNHSLFWNAMVPKSGGEPTGNVAGAIKKAFGGPIIVNGGLDAAKAEAAFAAGYADLASFGSSFLANPDLPQRLKAGLPLNAPKPDFFFAGGEQGYTDYPTAG